MEHLAWDNWQQAGSGLHADKFRVSVSCDGLAIAASVERTVGSCLLASFCTCARRGFQGRLMDTHTQMRLTNLRAASFCLRPLTPADNRQESELDRQRSNPMPLLAMSSLHAHTYAQTSTHMEVVARLPKQTYIYRLCAFTRASTHTMVVRISTQAQIHELCALAQASSHTDVVRTCRRKHTNRGCACLPKQTQI